MLRDVSNISNNTSLPLDKASPPVTEALRLPLTFIQPIAASKRLSWVDDPRSSRSSRPTRHPKRRSENCCMEYIVGFTELLYSDVLISISILSECQVRRG